MVKYRYRPRNKVFALNDIHIFHSVHKWTSFAYLSDIGTQIRNKLEKSTQHVITLSLLNGNSYKR